MREGFKGEVAFNLGSDGWSLLSRQREKYLHREI